MEEQEEDKEAPELGFQRGCQRQEGLGGRLTHGRLGGF